MNISPISFINFKGTQKVNKMNAQAQRAFMSQPIKNDSFTNKAKAKLKDIDFLKKAATAVISAVLIGTALVKGKKCWNSVKSSNASQAVGNFFTSAKTGISNFILKFKK